MKKVKAKQAIDSILHTKLAISSILIQPLIQKHKTNYKGIYLYRIRFSFIVIPSLIKISDIENAVE